jgi:hypothetical protein
MTATLPALHQVGDRVYVHRKGQRIPGRISSVHRSDHGVEYVIRTEPADGGHGSVVNIWTTSGQSSFISAAGSTR